MESSDITSPPNIETHMNNTRVTFPITLIESINDDVKMEYTNTTNYLNDMTPKENKNE